MLEVVKDDITEKELVEGCVAYNKRYQEMLYRKYADKMYNVSLTYTESEDDACDILQDGFITIFRNIHKFNFDGSLEGWIRKIIVNTALQLYRKRKREKEVFEDFGRVVESKIEGILEKINASEIMQLVNDLPAKAAMVLKLYAIEGYSHKEIADFMGVTEGTTKSQLNRARGLLKEVIAKRYA